MTKLSPNLVPTHTRESIFSDAPGATRKPSTDLKMDVQFSVDQFRN